MEQAQTKISKYAAKQERLATDPAFGTDYSDRFDKVQDQIAAGIDAATARREAAIKDEQQARFDKIYKMQAEIHTLEHRIENAKAHIVKLTAAIERQKELLLQ
jgi:hypothetical protein